MEISELKRTELNRIDLSNNVKYSAVINGKKLVTYMTDGFLNPHLSLNEWEDFIYKNCL